MPVAPRLCKRGAMHTCGGIQGCDTALRELLCCGVYIRVYVYQHGCRRIANQP